MFDPAALSEKAVSPPVFIEELSTQGRTGQVSQRLSGCAMPGGAIRGTRAETVTLSAGSRNVAFRFTTPYFTSPEQVLFRTCLEGYDAEWSSPIAERVKVYARLPPGEYRFRVMASTLSDGWREAEQGVRFVVKPLFWQTVWFSVTAGLFALGMTGLSTAVLVRNRARRKQREERALALERERALEREKAVEHERARIAKDIHDDMGASMTRILLQSKAARSDMKDASPRLPERLQAIEATAVEMIGVMDEIVWAVNPQNDTFDGLVTYLGRYAEEFLKLAGIRCRLDLPLESVVCQIPANVRHGMFLAFKEALNNAARHSAARVVRISVRAEPNRLELLIEDDGKGFVSDPLQKAAHEKAGVVRRSGGGNGLNNMRQRLAEIGGECVIESEPGKGARVRFLLTESGS